MPETTPETLGVIAAPVPEPVLANVIDGGDALEYADPGWMTL